MGLMIAETEGEEAGYDTESLSFPSVLSCQSLRALIIIPALSSLAVPGPMMLSGQKQLGRQWHHLLGTRRLVRHSYYYVNTFSKKHRGRARIKFGDPPTISTIHISTLTPFLLAVVALCHSDCAGRGGRAEGGGLIN